MTGATRTLCIHNLSCRFDTNNDNVCLLCNTAVSFCASAHSKLLSPCHHLWRILRMEECLEYPLDLLPQARVKSMPEVLQFDNLDLYCSVMFSLPRRKIPTELLTDHNYAVWGYFSCVYCDVFQECLFFFIHSIAALLSACAVTEVQAVQAKLTFRVNSNDVMPDVVRIHFVLRHCLKEQ